VALLVAVGAAWGMVTLASGGKGPVQVRLGEDVFDAGQSARLSKQIAADGPLLFSDVSGRGQVRPIYVNHFGEDPSARWVAVSAVAPGAPEGCFLSWSSKRNLFEERRAPQGGGRDVGQVCRPVTYAADGSSGSDGTALEQFPWRIDKQDNLVIDLKPNDKPTG
jgi:hypothetical protein